MGKLKKFIMNKIEKVNVQVSMLTCGLIIFSCLVIYLVTSGVMISMLADAYNERANLTFTTIESHFDSRLFTEDVPDGVYGAALSYLSAVKDNMAISEIFVVRKDKNGDFQYILDTKNDKINTVINDEKITGKIEKEINDLYTTHYADVGAFYASLDGFRYLNFYPIMDGGTVKAVACIGIDCEQGIYFQDYTSRYSNNTYTFVLLDFSTFFNGDIQEDFKSAVSGYVEYGYAYRFEKQEFVHC